MTVPMYEGAEQDMVDVWVEQVLTAQAADLDAIAAGLSTRIYLDFAPRGTQFPFIIFQAQSPPRDVRGVGVSRVMVDTLYVVKAVAQASSYAPLRPIAGVIDRAMTSATPSPVAEGFVLDSIRQEQFSLVEVEAGTQYRHLGGQYRIQAQATQ